MPGLKSQLLDLFIHHNEEIDDIPEKVRHLFGVPGAGFEGNLYFNGELLD